MLKANVETLKTLRYEYASMVHDITKEQYRPSRGKDDRTKEDRNYQSEQVQTKRVKIDRDIDKYSHLGKLRYDLIKVLISNS